MPLKTAVLAASIPVRWQLSSLAETVASVGVSASIKALGIRALSSA
jgi:hypothetical protein